jgi:predicted nuclease of predicted toxin-antitoxin system
MKILLDENLDHRLRNHLGAHEVFTAGYMGWDGLKNGKLIRVAEDDGFDVLLTGDQTLCYEQNLSGKRLAVIAMSSVEAEVLGKGSGERFHALLDEYRAARLKAGLL